MATPEGDGADPVMDAARWRKIEHLFHETLARPVDQRTTYLTSVCDDPTLLREVSALVEAESRSEAVDRTVVGAADWAADRIPEHIGPYRVLERLGEGGLATVYLAERADQHYRMRVAIKVVKRGMDTAEILRRLRLERQILANLDHPNVARLLDGGSTESGQPYVVMEAIDGDPIDRHCDDRRLDLRQRLTIFRKVCAAVQAAHRSLVIHRDLKPSNILVTDDGEPKLLDFGIAKLLDPGGADQTLAHTVTGVRWLTPEYASPEQVRGEPLTTAADVYALGVLLYELLCGERPHRITSRDPRVIEEQLMKTEPARPSGRVLGASKAAVARRSTPERLARRLRGDLDTIVRVAMHKDPARRYASVQALDDDVRRWLVSRPIAARPDSAVYSLSKFVARHRAAVTASVLVALSLIVGIVGIARALIVADRERQRAERHLEELEEVVAFNVEMFEIADPGEARGNALTVREVIDRAAERVPRELGDRPAVASRLLSTLGRVHQALGLYDPATSLLEQALERRRVAFGDDSLEAAVGLAELAGALRDQGRLDEALVYFRQALDRFQDLRGRNHPAVADVLHGLATVHVTRGEYGQGEAMHAEALAIREAELGPSDPATAQSINDRAEALFYLERFEEAQPPFTRALALRRQRLGPDHPAVAETLNNLAAVASKLNQHREAASLFQEALVLRRKLFPNPHRDVVVTLHNIALALGAQDRLGDAETYLREALSMAEQIEGGDPLDVARELRGLGSNLENQGRLAEAEGFLRRALDVEREQLGEAQPSVVMTRYALARVLAEQSRPRDAIDMLEAQLTAQRQIEDMPPMRLAYPLTLLAELRAGRDECDLAEAAMTEALHHAPQLVDNAILNERRARFTARCDD